MPIVVLFAIIADILLVKVQLQDVSICIIARAKCALTGEVGVKRHVGDCEEHLRKKKTHRKRSSLKPTKENYKKR